jgi:hypothetical protein
VQRRSSASVLRAWAHTCSDAREQQCRRTERRHCLICFAGRDVGLRRGDAAIAAIPIGQREGNKKAGSYVTWVGPHGAG